MTTEHDDLVQAAVDNLHVAAKKLHMATDPSCHGVEDWNASRVRAIAEIGLDIRYIAQRLEEGAL